MFRRPSPFFAVRQISTRSCKALAAGPVKDFLLADIGEGIAEVEVLEWTVQPGTKVQEFDELLKVQSDKAATEITSPYEGTVLELMVKVGDMAKVGKPLCRIELANAEEDDSGDSNDAGASKEKATAAIDSTPQKQSMSDTVDSDFKSGKVLTSPAVRRLAKENSIDLSQVPATGPKGRILKKDVLAFIQAGVGGPPSSTSTSSSSSSSSSSAAPHDASDVPKPALKTPPRPSISTLAEDIVVPVRGLDRIMVQTMNEAHKVPSLLYSDEFSVDELIEVRSQSKSFAEARGVKLTYLPFIIKAASMALQEYPKLNSHVNDDWTEYTMKGAHNIGVAVQTEAGLLVPNVKNCEQKSVLEIASELVELQRLGASGNLTKDHLSGGTFTISNIGSIGGTVCKPLLVVPEVAIAALGKFQAVPRFDEDDEIYKATIMNVSISADHRIIDGATVARFSNLWKQYLELPAAMLLHAK
eukprot:jgi/Bigna1/51785/estExt_Genewise1Plus.C_30168